MKMFLNSRKSHLSSPKDQISIYFHCELIESNTPLPWNFSGGFSLLSCHHNWTVSEHSIFSSLCTLHLWFIWLSTVGLGSNVQIEPLIPEVILGCIILGLFSLYSVTKYHSLNIKSSLKLGKFPEPHCDTTHFTPLLLSFDVCIVTCLSASGGDKDCAKPPQTPLAVCNRNKILLICPLLYGWHTTIRNDWKPLPEKLLTLFWWDQALQTCHSMFYSLGQFYCALYCSILGLNS